MDDPEGCLGGLIALVIGIFLLVKILEYTLSAGYWVLATVSYGVVNGLEWLFSGALYPERPEVMWALWGAALGGVLGFHGVAHVYGLKKYRNVLVLLVFVAMVAVASIW
ncbi:MAG TPA: hypothetical protein GXX23_04950 [Firmicutes bacterium]|nr:hypothetical protein [Candidatus Fermentithermobacillaceae bacterium]